MDRGRHNGLWLSAIKRIRATTPGTVIDARWIAAQCGLTAKQAFNALQYARRLGLVSCVERGRYAAVAA